LLGFHRSLRETKPAEYGGGACPSFANVLLDLDLPRADLVLGLLGFNAGVELGQLTIVAAILPLTYRCGGRPGPTPGWPCRQLGRHLRHRQPVAGRARLRPLHLAAVAPRSCGFSCSYVIEITPGPQPRFI
jgi:hypothetical protein